METTFKICGEEECGGRKAAVTIPYWGMNDTHTSQMDSHITRNRASHGDTVTPSAEDQEAAILGNLEAEAHDQDDLERNIGREADRMLLEQATGRDQQRLKKTSMQKEKLLQQMRKTREEISRPIGITKRAKLRNEVDKMQSQVEDLDRDLAEIEDRMSQRQYDLGQPATKESSDAGRLPGESQRDYLIRTGKITPFSKFGLSSHGESSATLQGALFDAEDEREVEEMDARSSIKLMSHRNLKQPGFDRYDLVRSEVDSSGVDDVDSDRPRKKRKISPKPQLKPKVERDSESPAWYQSDDQSATGSTAESDDDSDGLSSTKPTPRTSRRRRPQTGDDAIEDLRGVDDGNENVYQVRLQRWISRRSRARNRGLRQRIAVVESVGTKAEEGGANETEVAESSEEPYLPHPELADTNFDGGFKVPGDIYPNLFDYQKTGVQWLWELYANEVGGIVGDEMGLGKTIQIIAFLAGLQYSKKLTKPVIVVCPATVMKQWVNEFHRWWPPFRVTILHSSGSGMINLQSEISREDDMMGQMWDPNHQNEPLTASQKQAKRVLRPILEHGGVLITTYSGLQSYAPLLIPIDWDYAVLDEGHKIRNPNTAITIYCKELRTPNRIILSGTPMQNNLIELWSLFDFVFPMRLGTLVNFRTQFEVPIRQGGYANASNLQVQTAFKCAETLKDAISPYLLQRFKIDVAADLPRKSEQVLFCKLTKLQRDQYQRFLGGGEMDAIHAGKRQVLYGVDILRKISNHPDLVDHRNLSTKPGYDYGDPVKSGKMQVVSSLLDLWRRTGHKTLLFAQHRIMLDILEKFMSKLEGIRYRRMDGNTPIALRQGMVDEFNHDSELHVFLLTTKVGGLGVNLTGADRVIIFDPDWNPSTDLQARERAWRLGQKREVTIYRLLTAGTIEEKIYHRQIFKQFLTNKILKDPKQRQTFHMSDLHDLFSLGDEGGPTETSTLFKDAEITYNTEKPRAEIKNGQPPPAPDDAVIEEMNGVQGVEQYAGEIAEEEQKIAKGFNNSEARMMEGIFARSGVSSAIDQETVLGGRKIAADPKVVEYEARKVAEEAARELRKAGAAARCVPIGTPTWTGQFGVSGRPQEQAPQRAFGASARARGGGISSTSLIAGLQNRGTNGVGRAATPGPVTAGSSNAGSRAGTPARGKDFARLIQDYLSNHGGSVYTQMLVDHFTRMCTNAKETAEFKESLKVMCIMEKGGRGRAKWVLKDEYRK